LLLIYTERSFRIGDEIEWGDSDVAVFNLVFDDTAESGDRKRGTVEHIGLRSTRIRTRDDQTLTVPNSQLTDAVLANVAAAEPLRLEVDFPVDWKINLHPEWALFYRILRHAVSQFRVRNSEEFVVE